MKCKQCNKEIDQNAGFRNECPKAFCGWYCANEYSAHQKWLAQQKVV